MTTRSQLEHLKRLLAEMPRELLVDAIAEYSISEDKLRKHLIAVGLIANPDYQDEAVDAVLEIAGEVFGDRNIPGSLSWQDRTKFFHVHDLVDAMMNRGMHEGVIQVAECCFEDAANLSGVHEPDDFLECYAPILRAWILALHATNISSTQIAKQIDYLERTDGSGAFYNLAERFSRELGPDVLLGLKELN